MTLEVLILVLGILGALAIESWWQDRQDARRVVEYLQQLSNDLAKTEAALDSALVQNRLHAARIDTLRAAFRADVPPPDSVLRRLNQVGYAWAEPITGTATAMIQTGDLRLVRDAGLRAAIVQLVGESDEYVREMNTYLWSWGGPNFLEMYTAGYLKTDPRLPFARTPGELLQDEAYFAAVNGLALAYVNVLTQQRNFIEDVRGIRARTDSVLAASSTP